MLTLMLLRHAKAVPQDHRDDFARALNEKGRSDAMQLGLFLGAKDLVPDQVLLSPSIRTKETLECLQEGLGRVLPADFDRTLYNASRQQMRDTLRRFETKARTLMIIGHNPGILDLALALADDGDPQDFHAMRSKFPPCSLAVITFDRETWLDANQGGGRLERFVTPELLASS